MATRYHWMADTQPEAFAVYIDMMRKMPPGEKMRIALEMAAMMLRAYEDRVRREYPNAGEREVFLRAAALRLGRDTVLKVYGWDPESGAAP
ncbi:MAG: hypothetical protein HY235_07705 [Acidobacteria bacterium]|nr:hypothetical protein [Acidobacteriota bacterium]